MLVIVGHKITMQQGEDCAFRVLVKNLKGELVPLSEFDKITMRVRGRRKPDILITKVTSPMYITNDEGSTELAHVFEFNSVDTSNLPYGDYYYDVTLESDNERYTIIPKSVLEISMSVEYSGNHGISVSSDEEINPAIIYPTPLIGVFSYVEFNRTYINPYEDTLILY